MAWQPPEFEGQGQEGFVPPEFAEQPKPEEPKEESSALGAALKAGARAFPSLAIGGEAAAAAEPAILPIAAATGPLAPITHGVLSLGTALAATIASRWTQDKAAEAFIPKDTPVLSELRPEVAQKEAEEHPTATMAGELFSGGTPNLFNLARTGKTVASLLTKEGRPLITEAYQNLGKDQAEKWIKAGANEAEQHARAAAVKGIQSTLQTGIGAGMFSGQALVEGRPIHDVLTEGAIGAAFTGKSPIHAVHDWIGQANKSRADQLKESIGQIADDAAKAPVHQSIEDAKQEALGAEGPDSPLIPVLDHLQQQVANKSTAPAEPEPEEPAEIPDARQKIEDIKNIAAKQNRPLDPHEEDQIKIWEMLQEHQAPKVETAKEEETLGKGGWDKNQLLQKVPQFTIDRFMELASEKKNAQQIAHEMNMDETVVRALRDSLGIPPVSEDLGMMGAGSGSINPEFLKWKNQYDQSKKTTKPVVSEETPLNKPTEPVETPEAPSAVPTLGTDSNAPAGLETQGKGHPVFKGAAVRSDDGSEIKVARDHITAGALLDKPLKKGVPTDAGGRDGQGRGNPQYGFMTDQGFIERPVRESMEGHPQFRKKVKGEKMSQRKLLHSDNMDMAGEMSLSDVERFRDSKGKPDPVAFEDAYTKEHVQDVDGSPESREDYLNRMICP